MGRVAVIGHGQSGRWREEKKERTAEKGKNKALLFLLSSSFWLGLLGLDWLCVCVFGLSPLFLFPHCVVVVYEWMIETEGEERGKGKGRERAWL
jgi:hypothetical protein